MRTSETPKYEIIIFWSQEDEAFAAEVPELPGCTAHGESYEKALANVRKAMDLWMQTARELGRGVPKPKGQRLIFA
jgi:predicted RNase H-like HicB family nuclease